MLFISKPDSRRYFILYTSGSVTKFYCDYRYLKDLPSADNACLQRVCKCSGRFCCSETDLYETSGTVMIKNVKC